MGSGRSGPNAECGLPLVIVGRPNPNRHSQMAFVEWNQQLQTFATKAAAESFAHPVRLWDSHRRK
jgi:hypothetical protein